MVENVLARRVDKPLTADRHGDAVGTGNIQAAGHLGVGGVFAGAHDEPAGERDAADDERCIVEGGYRSGGVD